MSHNNYNDNSGEDTLRAISSYILMWIGIVMCVLCAAGFFVSTDWLLTQAINASSEYQNNDSDAASLLFKIEMIMLDVALWLKNLPVATKVIGIIIGGLLWFSNSDD